MTKHTKKQKRASIIASMIIMTAGLTSCNTNEIQPTNEFNNTSNQIKTNYPDLQNYTLNQIKQYNMSTTNLKYGGVYYQTANEEEVLAVSNQLSKVIKDYFKSYGASDWTNPDNQQFWPEDIEYIVTAIAFRESSYRTNYINDKGCGGITGLNEEETLKTLKGWLHRPDIWGENYPNVNCNPEEVDIFNPVTSLEYTYYNIGYLLKNRFQKDRVFLDEDGTNRSVWNVLPYSEDTQNRLVIACHLFGIGNVVDAVFGRQKDGVKIEDYINSDYVNDVMNKAKELKLMYNQEYQK